MSESMLSARPWSPCPPRLVVCSPLTAAIQTAQAVASFTGSEISIDPRLIDRDYGP